MLYHVITMLCTAHIALFISKHFRTPPMFSHIFQIFIIYVQKRECKAKCLFVCLFNLSRYKDSCHLNRLRFPM